MSKRMFQAGDIVEWISDYEGNLTGSDPNDESTWVNLHEVVEAQPRSGPLGAKLRLRSLLSKKVYWAAERWSGGRPRYELRKTVEQRIADELMGR